MPAVGALHPQLPEGVFIGHVCVHLLVLSRRAQLWWTGGQLAARYECVLVVAPASTTHEKKLVVATATTHILAAGFS